MLMNFSVLFFKGVYVKDMKYFCFGSSIGGLGWWFGILEVSLSNNPGGSNPNEPTYHKLNIC